LPPPPYLHACTTSLPKTEGFVSKRNNSLPNWDLING
jgi:hypothetical protein